MKDSPCGWIESEPSGRPLIKERRSKHVYCAKLSERPRTVIYCPLQVFNLYLCHAGHIIDQSINLALGKFFLIGKGDRTLILDRKIIRVSCQIISIYKSQFLRKPEEHLTIDVGSRSD